MRLFSNNDANTSHEPEISSVDSYNTSKMVEEDALLLQIDEFRRKAEALQTLINERQDKFLQLEETVREKESKNYVLQNELSKKQEALNGIFDDMKVQFDILADRMDTSVVNAVTEAKEPVLDKIHTENVRLYRNIYDFIKEDYDTDEIEELIKKSTSGGKGMTIAAFVLTIVNTIMLIVVLLIQFGVI